MNLKPAYIKLSIHTRIALAGALGGPLAISYLLTGKLKEGNRPWFVFLWIAGIVMACGLLFIPEELILSGWVVLLPLFFFFYTYTLLIQLQSRLELTRRAGNLLLITLFGLIFSIGTFVLSYYSVPNPGFRNRIEFSNPKVRLHYHRTVRPEDAGRIAQMLHHTRFTDNPDSLDMFLSQTDSCILLRFSLSDTLNLLNPLFVAEFKKMEMILNNQTVLSKPIRIGFTSPYLRRNYQMKDVLLPTEGIHFEILSLLSNRINDNQTVLYNISVRDEDLEILKSGLAKLKKYFPSDARIDVIFELKYNQYNLKFFVNKSNWDDPAQKHRLRLVGEYLMQSGISKPIKVFMVDSGGEKVELP